ncbi:Glycosyl transferase family 2 [Cupriavidus necator]|uniref:glycosyltransferase family 2 protein n=1 Tax=Cupriavidus necator TaxID=106590 RepID=UPI003F7357D1
MSKILVFIPAYNCERQIGRTLQQFTDANIASQFSQILVLDNRSSDNTVDAALNAANKLPLGKVLVARNRENVGLGGSHKNAFRFARRHGFSHVAVLHGDDQGSIADLLPILKADHHLKNDCCLGGRFYPGSRLQGYSAFRTIGNRVFNLIFSLAARKRIYDLGSGLNIYKTEAIKDDFIERFANDLTFNCYLLLYSIAKKQKISFFPISWREDDQVSNVKLFSQARRTLMIALRYLAQGRKSLDVTPPRSSESQRFDIIST